MKQGTPLEGHLVPLQQTAQYILEGCIAAYQEWIGQPHSLSPVQQATQERQSVRHLSVAERRRPAARVGRPLDLALRPRDRGRQGAPRDHEHGRHHGEGPDRLAQLRGADTSEAVPIPGVRD